MDGKEDQTCCVNRSSVDGRAENSAQHKQDRAGGKPKASPEILGSAPLFVWMIDCFGQCSRRITRPRNVDRLAEVDIPGPHAW